MRWQFGGNLQPVRMICEFDWKECPIAVANYVWSEIVTDVVDCLTNETVLWRMVAVLLVFTMLLHMAYYKVGLVDEAEMNRDDLNKVGYKVQDLELKVNILSYKMRYGTWPMPHEIRTSSLKELRNVKLTLSNTSRHSFWTKHPFTDHDGNTYVTFSKHKLHSMQHLTKLFNFETQYLSSQFEQDVSPIPKSSRTISGRSSRCTQKSIRCHRENNLKQKQPSKSEHFELTRQGYLVQIEKGDSCPKRTQPQNHARLQNNSKTDEVIMETTDDCRNNKEEIKSSNKSLVLIGSSSEISVGNSAKDVFVETQPEESSSLKDPKTWYKICTCEDEDEQESHENDLNVSNHIADNARVANEKLQYIPTDMIFSAGGEQYATESSPRMKKPKMLPPGLSITLLTDRYHSIPIMENRRANRVKESTSETLCRVKYKLENIHNVLQSCEPRDTRRSSSTTIDENIRSDGEFVEMILQNAADAKTTFYNIPQNHDNKSTEMFNTMNQNNSKDEQTSSSHYEECENERIISTSFSWASVEQLDAVFGVEDAIEENDLTCSTNLMDSESEHSSVKNIMMRQSNVERICSVTHGMDNNQQEFRVCENALSNDDNNSTGIQCNITESIQRVSSLNAHLPTSPNISRNIKNSVINKSTNVGNAFNAIKNVECREKNKTLASKYQPQHISIPSTKNGSYNSSPRNTETTRQLLQEDKPSLPYNDSVRQQQYTHASSNAHLPTSPNISRNIKKSMINTSTNVGNAFNDIKNVECREENKTLTSKYQPQHISIPSTKNSSYNISPRNKETTVQLLQEDKPSLPLLSDSVRQQEYKLPNARGTSNSHTSPQNSSNLHESTTNKNLNEIENISIKHPNDSSKSATQKEVILPINTDTSYEFESNCQRMETDDDMTVTSLESSQTELSKSSSMDDQSTATLLREALEFKKILLMQIDKESQMAQTKESTDENNEYDSCETLKSKNDNHFQSKLLDIISEEQSASSSMDKPSKTYIMPERHTEKIPHESLTQPITRIVNNIKHSHDTVMKTDTEHETRVDSQSALASTSSEYFSIIDKTDNEQTSRHSAGDYVSNQKLNQNELIKLGKSDRRNEPSLQLTKSHSSGIHRLDRSKHLQTAYKNNAIGSKTKAESIADLKYSICSQGSTDKLAEKAIEKVPYDDRKQFAKNKEQSVNSKYDLELYKKNTDLKEQQEIIENCHRSRATFTHERKTGSKQKQQIIVPDESDEPKNIDEFRKAEPDLERIDDSAAESAALRENSIEKVQNPVRNINDLLIESMQSITNYSQLTSQNHNEKQLSHKVIENWSLNFLEHETQVPWNPMTESSSDESMTQFINALANKDSKSIEAITEQKLLTLKSTECKGMNYVGTGESVKCNPNLDLKRRPGTFSIARTNWPENNTKTTKDVSEMGKPRKRSRNSSENDEITTGSTNLDSDESSVLRLQSNQKYGLEKLQKRQDILTKLKTLDTFTKPLEINEGYTQKIEIAEDSSPLSGRTIVLSLNNVERFCEITGSTENVEQSQKFENKISNIPNLKTSVKYRNIEPTIENDESLEPNNNLTVISNNINSLDDQKPCLEKYNSYEKKSIQKSHSNLKSEPSSLYLTDNASSSNFLLDFIQKDELIETFPAKDAEANHESLKNTNTNNKTQTGVSAFTDDNATPSNSEGGLKNVNESNATSRMSHINMLDTVKTLNLTDNQNTKCNNLNIQSVVENSLLHINKAEEKLVIPASEIKSYAARPAPHSIRKQMSSKSNMSSETSDSYIDVCNNEFAVSSTILFPNDSVLKASIKKTRQHPLSNGGGSNNTSTSYVDVTDQDFEAASNISLTLDKSILNPPPNKIEISALKKSIVNNDKSNNDKTAASKRSTNSLQKQPKQIVDFKKLRRSRTDASEHATGNMKILNKIPRRETTVQCKQICPKSSPKKSQLTAKSNLNISSSGLKSQWNTVKLQHSVQSSINLSRNRSKSQVTPRQSQLSAHSSGNLNPDYSKSQKITEKNKSKMSVTSGEEKLTSKISSRSCIPVLKTRVNEKKAESAARSRSPVRGPLTMSNPCGELTQPMISVQDQNRIIDQSKKASLNVELQSEAYTNMPEEGRGEAIPKTSGELCGTIQKFDHIEHKGPSFVPKECTVIYVNIISGNEQSETHVGDPKELMERVHNKNLMLQHVQSIPKDMILSLNNIKVQSSSGELGIMNTLEHSDKACSQWKPANVSDILNITNTKGLTTTVFSSGMGMKESNVMHLSNAAPLQNKHATASKILSTSTLEGTWSFRVEQKEIEVSAKPSVMDNSTSVSDFPDVPTGRMSLWKKPQYEVYEIPKELTEEEHILLLEALQQDPNFFENRRSHKPYSNPELGSQDQLEHS